MSIKTIVIAVVAILGIGGAGAGIYLATQDNDDNTQASSETTSSNTSNQSTVPPGENTSINELLKLDRTAECTFSYQKDDNESQTSGTIYIDKERMSGNFAYTLPNQPTKSSSIIRDTDFQYVWDQETKKGIKTSLASLEQTLDNAQNDAPQANDDAVNQDQKFDFDCKNWNVDEAKFNPPNDVEFTDYSQQLQQLQDSQEGVQQNLNQACAAIPDAAARAACESSL